MIKQALRKIVPVRAYERLSAAKFACLTLFSPAWNSRVRWKSLFQTELCLDKPRSFNEKLMWLKLNCYGKSPLVRRLADKYQVLAYVEAQGFQHMIKTCYGVWERPEAIDFDALPDQFVLKTTLGCGNHIFCHDKASFDRAAAVSSLRRTQKSRAYLQYAEMQYRPTKATPNLIMAERMMEPDGTRLPNDYKIYCFYGEPRFILTCFNRQASGSSYLFTDTNWRVLPYHPSSCTGEAMPRPACLDEMLLAARGLTRPFPFVRADFFEENGKPIFGELTFTPAGCLDRDYTEAGRIALGEALDLTGFDPAALIQST